MEITRLDARSSYLFAAGCGEFDPAQAMTLFKTVVDECQKHKHNKLLIDFTQVEGEISILVLYDLGIKTAQQAAGISHLALIDRPERILPDRFWQTVTRNNGLSTLVTASFREAEEWLNKNCGSTPSEEK
jgi:hypothetical protein